MKVILSIKPEFALKIFEGTKKYEFRRAIFRNPEIKTVLVYASSPTKMVIGEFTIERIIRHDVETLWRKTRSHSGITEEYFFEYFDGKEQGFAIKIMQTRRYRVPKCIRRDYQLSPPQSFVYV